MSVVIPNAVSLEHDGDVWRATLGDHAANSLDPFHAIILVVGKACEAGHKFDPTPIPAPKPGPTVKPDPPTPVEPPVK